MRTRTFTQPWGNMFWMLVFAGVIAGLGYLVFPTIEDAFFANQYINGLIIIVLLIGVLYTFHQVMRVSQAASWLTRFQRANVYDDLSAPPAIIKAMTQLLGETPGEAKLSAPVTRSMLDSVGARLTESGEITKYMARLLVFLGLLGTFWGLLETLGGVVAIVNELGASTDGNGSVNQLFLELEKPLEGMGTAFSSSIFGIAGSLILGFLDLQASQTQNRFYNEVEDWLARLSRVNLAEALREGEGGGSNVTSALIEQLAESFESLQQSLRRSEDINARTSDNLSFLASEMSALNNRLGRQEESLDAIRERATDPAVANHVRNIDQALREVAKALTDGKGSK